MTAQPIELSSLPGGNLEGYLHGALVSVIFEHIERDGVGPRLHRHPYDETFSCTRWNLCALVNATKINIDQAARDTRAPSRTVPGTHPLARLITRQSG